MKSTLKKHKRYLYIRYIGERMQEKEIEGKLNVYLEKSLGMMGLIDAEPRVMECKEEEII